MMCSVLCYKVLLKNVRTVMTCHIVLRAHNKILYSCQIFIIYQKTELDMGLGRFIASSRPTYHTDTSPHKFQLSTSLQNFEQTPFRTVHLTSSPDGSVGMSRSFRIVARNAYLLFNVYPSVCPSVRPSFRMYQNCSHQDKCALDFILRIVMKICQGFTNLIKIGQFT